MPDQANDLRQLVRQCLMPSSANAPPRRIVVAGGKGGVGTTTVAMHLAIALGRRGTRVLLIDGSGSGDLAILCRLEPRHTLADVLCGARTVAEAIQVGPSGVLVLPGTRDWQGPSGHAAALDRLLAQLATLGPRADVIVIDAGNVPGDTARQFWQAADVLLLLTTPMAAAVMDAYAAVKLLAEPGRTVPPSLLVNMAPHRSAAEDVYGRLQQACRRFLGIEVADAGHLPMDARLAAVEFAAGAGSDCFDRLAQRLLTDVAGVKADFHATTRPLGRGSREEDHATASRPLATSY